MAAGLPQAVADTRMAIIEAAIDCDYRELEELALDTPADWEDIRGLYPDELIDQMRTGDSFLGFRVGILEDGDWVYFIAGD